MKYRAEIDGLRALAVVPVILFHAGFGLFSGGFVGVDVFFVISGYLITSIILQEVEEGNFSLLRFYERRARRILPALFVVVLACIPFAWLWMLPGEFKSFGLSLAGVATFTSNILFWRESGYFADTSELKPLLHTWSLAVEEQYYILFPPLLLLLYRLRRVWLYASVAIGTLVSLALAQHMSVSAPDANFFLLPTRAWELGIGVLVAFYLREPAPVWLRSWREIAGFTGLGMIVFAILVFDEATPFPSIWALVPVLGTALVILAADRDTLAGKALGAPLLVGIGLVSYSAYLWHQPLFAFAKIRLYENVPESVYGVLIAATFALAWLSWRYVETAARRAALPQKWVLTFAALGCLSLALLGGVFQRGGLPSRMPPGVTEMAAYKSSVSPVRTECHAGANAPISPSDACILGAQGAVAPVYVWGDSHGVELAWQLASTLRSDNVPVMQLTSTQCLPAIGIQSDRERHCEAHNERVFAFLTAEASRSIVVLMARWPLYFNGARIVTGEGCSEPGAPGARFPVGWADGTEEARIAALGEKVRETIAALLEAGQRVVLVHGVPEPGCNVPNRLARRSLFGDEEHALFSIPHAVVAARSKKVETQLALVSDNVLHVYPESLFCNEDAGIGRCMVETDEGLLYFDNNHPSLIGAKVIADALRKSLQEQGWLVDTSSAPTVSLEKRSK